MHNLAIGTITIFLYLASAAILGVRLRKQITTPGSKWKSLLPAILAIVMHAFLLSSLLFTEQGLDLGIYKAISLITWFIATIMVISAINRPIENLGIFIFPDLGNKSHSITIANIAAGNK